MSDSILLSITMLVSDRISTIEKCMRSLEHLRKAVPSELIVVDTARNAACMDIVRRYADKIIPFTWCDDFSAARNAGLKEAKGQWVMYLDDDEWFESTAQLEHFFLSGEYREYHSASYLQRNYQNLEGTKWSDTDVMRLAQREKGLHFYGRIHEILMPMSMPSRFLQDYVHHYGYVYTTRQDQNRHFWRNIRLLLEMRRENPQDFHAAAQLIQEYCAAEEYFSALELCRDLRDSKGCWAQLHVARYSTYAVQTEMKIYLLQERFADGCRAGEEILAQKAFRDRAPFTVLARGILYGRLALFEVCLEQYEQALKYLGQFEACRDEWEAFPNQKELDAFSSCAVYMGKEETLRLALLKLHIYKSQEKWKEAQKLLGEIPWEESVPSLLQETPEDLCALLENVKAACTESQAPEEKCVAALQAVCDRNEMRPLLYRAVDSLPEEGKRWMLPYLYRLPAEDAQMCFYHLLYAAQEDAPEAAGMVLEKMRQERYPFFASEGAYWDSLWKLGIDLGPYMEDISLYEWMGTAEKLFSIAEPAVCEKAYRVLAAGLNSTDIRCLWLNGLRLEKELATSPPEDGALWEALLRWAQCRVSCAATLYREDVFMGGLLGAIPPAYQAAWYIMQANAVKNSDRSLFLHKIADAAKAYPALKEVCKRLLREA